MPRFKKSLCSTPVCQQKMLNAGYSLWPSSQKAAHGLQIPRGQVFFLEQSSSRATFTPHRQGWTIKGWGRGTQKAKPGVYEYVVASYDPREEKYICLEAPDPSGDMAIYCSQTTIVHSLACPPESDMKTYKFKHGYPPNWDLDKNLNPVGRQAVATESSPPPVRRPSPRVRAPVRQQHSVDGRRTPSEQTGTRPRFGSHERNLARCAPVSKTQRAPCSNATSSTAPPSTAGSSHPSATSSAYTPTSFAASSHGSYVAQPYAPPATRVASYATPPSYASSSRSPPLSHATPPSYPAVYPAHPAYHSQSSTVFSSYSFLEPECPREYRAMGASPPRMPTSASSFLAPEGAPPSAVMTPRKISPRRNGRDRNACNGVTYAGSFSPTRVRFQESRMNVRDEQYSARTRSPSPMSSGSLHRDRSSDDRIIPSEPRARGVNNRVRELQAVMAATVPDKPKMVAPGRVRDPWEAKRIINSQAELFGICRAKRKSYNQPRFVSDDRIPLHSEDGLRLFNVRVLPRFSDFAVHRKRDHRIFFPRGMAFIMRQEATTCNYTKSLRTGFPAKVYEVFRGQYDIICDPGVYEYVIAGWEPREEKYLCYEAGEVSALVCLDQKSVESAFDAEGNEKETEDNAITFEDQYPEQPVVDTTFKKLGYNITDNQKEVAAVGNFKEMSKYRTLDTRFNFM